VADKDSQPDARLVKCAEERLATAKASFEADDRTDWRRNGELKEALEIAKRDLQLIRKGDVQTALKLGKLCGDLPQWSERR
jgi:uncharacterized protein HemX